MVLGIVLHPPVYMSWGLAGSTLLVGRWMYFLLYKGAPSEEHDLGVAVMIPVFVLSCGINLWIHDLTPVTLDWLLARLDFGIAPWVRSWSLGYPAVYRLLEIVYFALPFFMALCAFGLNGQARLRLMRATFLGAALAGLCYILCPAVGPELVKCPSAARNCMPSMHLAWAMMLFLASSGGWKWLFGLIAFLTAWATLATGEHYILDLIAAVPWAYLMMWLTEGETQPASAKLSAAQGSNLLHPPKTSRDS